MAAGLLGVTAALLFATSKVRRNKVYHMFAHVLGATASTLFVYGAKHLKTLH